MQAKRQKLVLQQEEPLVEDDASDVGMLDEEELATEQVRLTKHVSVMRELPPLYTGGSFALLKNDRFCLALRDSKICLFELATSRLLSVISQENEEILCFAVSPNQHLLALSNKNYLIRVFALP
jgi:hypothetical protein